MKKLRDDQGWMLSLGVTLAVFGGLTWSTVSGWKSRTLTEEAWVGIFGEEYRHHRADAAREAEDSSFWRAMLSGRRLARARPAREGDCVTAVQNGEFAQYLADGIRAVSHPSNVFAAYEQLKVHLSTCPPEGAAKACLDKFNKAGRYFTQPQSEPDSELPDGGQGLLPQEILEIPPGGTVERATRIRRDIEEFAKSRGWKTVRYRSRHTGGFLFDNPNVMVVHVPGDDLDPPQPYDRFVQIQLTKEQDFTQSRPTSAVPVEGYDKVAVITLKKSSDLPRNHRPYYHVHDEGFGFRQAPIEGNQNCVACHNSGTRVISPLGYGHRFDDEPALREGSDAEELEEFNQLLMSYGSIDLRGRFSAWLAVMPEYGRIPGGNNDGFFTGDEGCATAPYLQDQAFVWSPIWPSRGPSRTFRFQNTEINPAKVMLAANSCVSCHNGTTRGRLINGRNDIVFKVLADRTMPVMFDLTEDERFAVVACLEKAFRTPKSDLDARLEMAHRLGIGSCR